MTGPRPLRIDHRRLGGCIVVTPVGVLATGSYPRLRDALLKHLAEQPVAVVVDLSGLEVTDAVVLSVFPAVVMVSATPSVPLLLAAATGDLGVLLDAGAVPRFVPTFPDVPSAVAAAASTPRRRHQIDLPCSPSATRQARQWTRELCTEWALPAGDPLDTIVLVAGELVENMVRHAQTPGRLRLEQHRSGLTVAVSDGSARPPALLGPRADHPVGGLDVVDALAIAWGHRPSGPDGKVVWAVLPFPVARPGTRPPPRRTSTAGLRDGADRAGLSRAELWLRYVALGGSLSRTGLADALAGGTLPGPEHDRLAHALNEYFTEIGDDYRVHYAAR